MPFRHASKALVIFILAAGCFGPNMHSDELDHPANNPAKDSSDPYQARLLDIGKSYETYRMLHELSLSTNACAAAFSRVEGMKLSKASTAAAHGKKMYFLFRKDQPVVRNGHQTHPVGQVIVKEAWIPEEVADPGPNSNYSDKLVSRTRKRQTEEGIQTWQFTYWPYVEKDSKFFHAGAKAELFIMFKVDPSTSETDQGWVYATMSSDGKKILSAGKLKSCMKCHCDAPNDRVFSFLLGPAK